MENSADELADTIPKERMDAFRDNPQSMSNADFWGTFTELGQNNIYTRKLKADELINRQVAAAENAARDEYLAGRGYAGTRECIATTADGKYCAKWQTLTPGSTIGGYNDRLAQIALEHLQGWNASDPSPDALQQSRRRALALGARI